MNRSPLIFLVLLIGCSHTERTAPAALMRQQIQQWIPKGTSVTAACRIMEQHEFSCTVHSYDSIAAMPPGPDKAWWNAGTHTNGNILTSVTNVTLVSCKRAATTNDIQEYNVKLTAVNGDINGRVTVWAHPPR